MNEWKYTAGDGCTLLEQMPHGDALGKKATPKTPSSSFESQYLKNKTNNKKQKEMLPTVSSVNKLSIAQ